MFNDLYKITKSKHIQHTNLEKDKTIEDILQKDNFDENIEYKSAKSLANYLIESKHFSKWNKDNIFVQCDNYLYKEVYRGFQISVQEFYTIKSKIERKEGKYV